MKSVQVVEIVTPKKVLLRGLWFGPANPKRTIIWVHGLGSSMFSRLSVVESLVDKDTAVLTFNNRGHDKISRIARANEKKFGKTVLGGSAHEVFTECVDDIQGAINFAKKQGVKDIFLAGHSTGCQKAIYWASKKKGRGVRGIVLLAPVSDFAAALHLEGKKKIARAEKAARSFVKRGKKHELLPSNVWHEVIDAQRFLSLYTPGSVEEIFTYVDPKKNPRTFRSVRNPILVLWPKNDEFSDRPAEKAREWFEKYMQNGSVIIVPSGHLFHGVETMVAEEMQEWVKTV